MRFDPVQDIPSSTTFATQGTVGFPEYGPVRLHLSRGEDSVYERGNILDQDRYLRINAPSARVTYKGKSLTLPGNGAMYHAVVSRSAVAEAANEKARAFSVSKNPSPNDHRAADLFAELLANREAWSKGEYGYDRFAKMQKATWDRIELEPVPVKEHVWMLITAENKARAANKAERLSWHKNPVPDDERFSQKELRLGITEETKEHGAGLAPRVVADHLALDPHYYTREKGKGGKVSVREKVTVERKVSVNPAKKRKASTNPTRISPTPKPNVSGLEERGYVWQLDCINAEHKPFKVKLGSWQWMLCHDPAGKVWPKNEAFDREVPAHRRATDPACEQGAARVRRRRAVLRGRAADPERRGLGAARRRRSHLVRAHGRSSKSRTSTRSASTARTCRTSTRASSRGSVSTASI